eukprot:6488928-Amphidinium_carterae.1
MEKLRHEGCQIPSRRVEHHEIPCLKVHRILSCRHEALGMAVMTLARRRVTRMPPGRLERLPTLRLHKRYFLKAGIQHSDPPTQTVKVTFPYGNHILSRVRFQQADRTVRVCTPMLVNRRKATFTSPKCRAPLKARAVCRSNPARSDGLALSRLRGSS